MDYFRGTPSGSQGVAPNANLANNVPPGGNPNPNPTGGGNTDNNTGNPGVSGGNDTQPGASGSDTVIGGAGSEDKSPMAEFSKLWETKPTKDAAGNDTTPSDPLDILPNLQADPKKMFEAASRIDFSKVMNVEKVKAALSGDSAAFSEVINQVAQAAFANSAMSTTRIVEAALKSMIPKLTDTAIPHLVRKHSVRETVVNENPIFADPAVAPMLQMLETQLSTQFPQASAKDISQMAKKYLGNLGTALNKGSEDTSNPNDGTSAGGKRTAQQEDWSTFLA